MCINISSTTTVNVNDSSWPQAVGNPHIDEKMKALKLIQYNKDMSKALKVNEIDVPQCGKDEILIKTHSTCLNPVDWKIAMGYLATVGKVNFHVQLVLIIQGIIIMIKIGQNILANRDNKINLKLVCELIENQGTFVEYIVTSQNTRMCTLHVISVTT